MSLRISSALVLLPLLLAACGPEAAMPSGDLIDCAIGGEPQLSQVCTLERVSGERLAGKEVTGGEELILHHPGGGFRRVVFDPAAGTIAVSDGVDEAVFDDAGADGALVFAIAADRYVIPAGLLTGRQ